MDLLIIVALVGALLVASGRWGYDSREGIRSKERELAAWGFTWEAPPLDQSRGRPWSRSSCETGPRDATSGRGHIAPQMGH